MAVLPDGFTYDQWNAVYNALSFCIAGMGACFLFVYFQLGSVTKKYKTALITNCMVTLIATYHYFRIFNSWNESFIVTEAEVNGTLTYSVAKSGKPFNDGYRYVDWLLTVPLLLIELVLVMGLSSSKTRQLAWRLGICSALMVGLGYPGEISDDQTVRWIFWALAMLPFIYILYELLVGLAHAGELDEPDYDEDEEEGLVKSIIYDDAQVTSLLAAARWVTAISWLTYPFCYLIKSIPSLSGAQATAAEQVAYSFADFTAKAVFGVLIWAIASTKSDLEKHHGKAS
eukprot:gnl/TRDRNA2_/TRDRNA2_178805_c0_seq1.p1 gnl/TRDRNA2_/TRDRNA2_178805_c0~~gnl/TRDRNA2_/TRDRNA2_178805_c0_seq1.p1  ORF type:complete len:313 (+),score=52.01 gnl/TRDRNA2_/TRDRNA2_178805_c0_seq1:84-941(+)